jgi:two-component system, NtrC family, sensor histidine kinase HydH
MSVLSTGVASRPNSSRNRFYAWTAIPLSIVFITVLHFLTPVDEIVWHEVYQRLYYVPIIASALLFGFKGGLSASLFTTVVYSPHLFLHAEDGHLNYSINQYAEIVIFNLVGGIMGTLGDRLRKARERAERNAEERRKAYDELQEAFQQLLQAEKLASLGELSAGIVHEVRNPLGSIKGAIEILEDEIDSESPRREFVDVAKTEIDRLDRLVGEFLRFARPKEPFRSATDLNEIATSVAALIEKQATLQSAVIRKELELSLPTVLLDSEQIKQVVLNIAINGLQAMSRSVEQKVLTFRTYRRGAECVLEITDKGSGVDSRHAQKIFDPFFTTKHDGVGLGLSIAHKIISQHGGRLEVDRVADTTVFRVTLPAIKEVGHRGGGPQ